jgi:transcription initiation factor TFIID subunit 7
MDHTGCISKSCDIAQLLVVYEDEMAMDEAENMPHYKSENFPSYYHSGLTPPLKRVVERRFEKRDHKPVPTRPAQRSPRLKKNFES